MHAALNSDAVTITCQGVWRPCHSIKNKRSCHCFLYFSYNSVWFLRAGTGKSLRSLTWWAGHDFHVVIGWLPPLQLLHQVLYVSKPVCQSKLEQNCSILLQCHLLEVLVSEEKERKCLIQISFYINFKEPCVETKFFVNPYSGKLSLFFATQTKQMKEPADKSFSGFSCLSTHWTEFVEHLCWINPYNLSKLDWTKVSLWQATSAGFSQLICQWVHWRKLLNCSGSWN